MKSVKQNIEHNVKQKQTSSLTEPMEPSYLWKYVDKCLEAYLAKLLGKITSRK